MKRKFSRILGVGLTVVLLVSLLLTAAPVSAVTTPVVTLTDADTDAPVEAGVISKPNIYTVLFTVGSSVPADGKIVVGFLAGTNIDAMNTQQVVIANTVGIGGGASQAHGVAAVTGVYPAAQTLTITLDDSRIIGAGAMVQLSIGVAGAPPTIFVTNPNTAGTYNLTVATKTSTGTVIEAAVTSLDYTIIVPTILPLPGVVERYNSANVLMQQTISIKAAVDAAADGDTILVGPGTYDEDADIAITVSLTITGDAATTIIKDTDGGTTGGTVTISFEQTATKAGVVFDGFTVMGNLLDTTPADGVADSPALEITGIGVTVQNSVFTKAGTATTAIDQNMIEVDPASSSTTYPNTITNSTFDTTLGAENDDGIVVYNGKLTISDSTFITDGVVSKDDLDRAVVLEQWKTSGDPLLAVTVKDNTFSGTGRKGIGADLGAEGTATISGNTFDGMNQAIESDAVLLTLTIKDNVIKNSGGSIAETVTSGTIDLGDSAKATITNNDFIDNLGYVLEVGPAGADNVRMLFNDMSGNAKMVLNSNTTETVIASHNYWDVAPTANATRITYLPVLAASPSEGALAVGLPTLITKTTVGVDVTATGTVPTVIGVANYTANPQDATPLPAIAGGFYDVYLAGATPVATDSVLIKFYNANITANTAIYVWGTIAGGWQAVTGASGVNTYGGYAYVTVTTATVPDIAGLGGTPFALVAAPLGALTVPDIFSPDAGERDIPLTPTFSWEQIPAAAGYYFQLADNANFVVPLVKLEGDLGRLIVTAYAYVGELDYSSAYYWRVKAVSGTEAAGNLAESAWSTGVFITMDEPVEPTPPIEIVEAPDLPDIVIEIPDIIVPLPAETPITPSWIYVIIGVGAVLVIALIVLIVRTRRVA